MLPPPPHHPLRLRRKPSPISVLPAYSCTTHPSSSTPPSSPPGPSSMRSSSPITSPTRFAHTPEPLSSPSWDPAILSSPNSPWHTHFFRGPNIPPLGSSMSRRTKAHLAYGPCADDEPPLVSDVDPSEFSEDASVMYDDDFHIHHHLDHVPDVKIAASPPLDYPGSTDRLEVHKSYFKTPERYWRGEFDIAAALLDLRREVRIAASEPSSSSASMSPTEPTIRRFSSSLPPSSAPTSPTSASSPLEPDRNGYLSDAEMDPPKLSDSDKIIVDQMSNEIELPEPEIKTEPESHCMPDVTESLTQDSVNQTESTDSMVIVSCASPSATEAYPSDQIAPITEISDRECDTTCMTNSDPNAASESCAEAPTIPTPLIENTTTPTPSTASTPELNPTTLSIVPIDVPDQPAQVINSTPSDTQPQTTEQAPIDNDIPGDVDEKPGQDSVRPKRPLGVRCTNEDAVHAPTAYVGHPVLVARSASSSRAASRAVSPAVGALRGRAHTPRAARELQPSPQQQEQQVEAAGKRKRPRHRNRARDYAARASRPASPTPSNASSSAPAPKPKRKRGRAEHKLRDNSGAECAHETATVLSSAHSRSPARKQVADPSPDPGPELQAEAETALKREMHGLLIQAMAVSRTSSMPASSLLREILRDQPHLAEEPLGADAGPRSKKAWLKVIGEVLEADDVFGRIERVGIDAAGKALEPQWFYIPEKDEDQERAALLVEMMPKKRSETKKHKQYYYRPLAKISRWDAEDDA